MKVPAHVFRRPLRYLLLVVTAGAVLAADNSWTTTLRFDFHASDWWSNISPAEILTADIAVVPDPVNHRAPELSMGRLLHGLLFSKPSTSWRLAPETTEVTSAWMTQQGGDTFAASAAANYYSPPAFFSADFVTSTGLTAPSAPTADGTWRANASGNWSDSTKWGGGVVADGAGNGAFFNTLDITTDVTVTLDSSRTIGLLDVADLNGTHHYTIGSSGGAALTFDNTGAGVDAALEQMGGSAGDTISAPILVANNLNINNLSATNQFTISGNIALSATSGFGNTLWFNPSGSGASGKILVSGNISNGTTGRSMNLVVGAGTVTLTGTNSYTGFTEVDGGTLLVNGNNTAATGTVYVYDTGTLGGTGTIGGSVNLFGGTITGATSTTVGTLTLLGNASFATGEGAGGTYLANLSGNLSDLLAITGNMVLGSDTTLSIVGAADGVTTYTLATFASHIDQFEFVNGLPSGYALVYHNTDLQLVPTAIPEPATWIGGALAFVAMRFASRRRKLRGA